jgi:hypothetical protein
MEEHIEKVHEAIKRLNSYKRSTNNSQISALTGLTRAQVKDATMRLKGRGHIKDVGKGSAYNWRIRTPDSDDDELAERQRRLNAQYFNDRRQ